MNDVLDRGDAFGKPRAGAFENQFLLTGQPKIAVFLDQIDDAHGIYRRLINELYGDLFLGSVDFGDAERFA